MSGPGLTLARVRITLAGSELLALDTVVRPGEILTVMGPSGSGKSTLLAFVAGMVDPAFGVAGRILIDGTDVTALPPERRHVGLLFQDALLFPHLSVLGNVLFGMPRARADRRTRAESLLAEAGLAGFGARDPATLSGGQRARVALLRLLASEPRVVLLDEPFSKLDAHLRAEIRAYVFARVRAAGLPTLLVTHDQADAEATGERIIRLTE
ncbi:MAG: ATP-binding cassette domain-containing protein [Candidatus Competibacterales bacterium]|nr:ATP-binding cassette domain-containing protein [Candidatus Competibacterales bacterium]